MLWFVSGDDRLSARARATIESPETISYISIASWWEIAIKCSLGKLKLDISLEKFIAQRANEGFRQLSIETEHLPALFDLPFHHRDPFDRLIICQAMTEEIPICTADGNFRRYSISVIW